MPRQHNPRPSMGKTPRTTRRVRISCEECAAHRGGMHTADCARCGGPVHFPSRSARNAYVAKKEAPETTYRLTWQGLGATPQPVTTPGALCHRTGTPSVAVLRGLCGAVAAINIMEGVQHDDGYQFTQDGPSFVSPTAGLVRACWSVRCNGRELGHVWTHQPDANDAQ